MEMACTQNIFQLKHLISQTRYSTMFLKRQGAFGTVNDQISNMENQRFVITNHRSQHQSFRK